MSDQGEHLTEAVTLYAGDCLDVLKTLAPNSVDSVVCDPPYHLHSIVKRFAKTGRTDKTRTKSGPHQRTANGFMNKKWDGGTIAFQPETWAAVLNVLKPGGYICAFSSSRTFGRMAVAIEDAGFITHPFVAWIFGQGFPKAHRVHDDAWEGWAYGGQALKPAIEPIYLGQKPFSEINGTANIRKWGVGAININACRVVTSENLNGGTYADLTETDGVSGSMVGPLHNAIGKEFKQPPGRWPANVIISDDPEVWEAFPNAPGQQRAVGPANGAKPSINVYGDYGPRDQFEPRNDSGSAARFFYSAKADADDRLGSKHPTVKPVDLIQYLVRLVTPPGGICLDLFAGTGTTGEACIREGFRAILIEREAEYQDDIRRRMRLAMSGPDERQRESIKAKHKDKPADHGPLFMGAGL